LRHLAVISGATPERADDLRAAVLASCAKAVEISREAFALVPGLRAFSWLDPGLDEMLLRSATPLAATIFAVYIGPLLAWETLLEGRYFTVEALLFAAGLVLPIIPVTLHNALVGHDFVPIASQGGVNFYIGNNPVADGYTAIGELVKAKKLKREPLKGKRGSRYVMA